MNDISVPPDFAINALMDMYLAKERECALLRISLTHLATMATAEPEPEPVATVNGHG